MDSKRSNRVKALFRVVAEMAAQERRTFLEAVCPDDTGVREEVERLADQETKDLRGAPPATVSTVRDHSGAERVSPGERIGPYKLLRKAGEGAMGLVFEAEQEEPIHRRVALKIIKPGMDSREVLARFDTERQVLALMNHRNIARVYDAGATRQGLPYFVMEFVAGVSITEYCDKNNLTTRERIGLFLMVCDAVRHAHQKGIIHRDLKPSNILVAVGGGEPTVKIIDFGIAKALDRRLTKMTLFTDVGQLIGTPEYMSPEQADLSSLDIDTRTDVYSLGVLLYQLLVGALPFESRELRRRGIEEIRRIIREEEPPRPSQRLQTLGEQSSDVAAHRHSDPGTLVRSIRGDLDWITMKALEKDRTRRYDSAAELAADIRRHIRDEPVLAGPPSTAYRAKKFYRRHRVAVVATAVVAASLVCGAALATAGMIRARRAEQAARLEADTANQVTDFLVGLFKVSDPGEARGNTITAREILDGGVKAIRTELTDRPALRARLLETMGLVYRSLGLYDDARPLLEGAIEDYRRAKGEESEEVAAALNSLGAAMVLGGKPDQAKPFLEEALRIQGKVLPAGDPALGRTLNNLGNVLRKAKRYDEAISFYHRSLAVREKALGPSHPDVAKTLNNLAYAYQSQKEFDEAEGMFRRALEIREKALGPDHPAVARTLTNLGNMYRRAGRLADAREVLRRALAIRGKVLGPDHPDVAFTLNNLAIVEILDGKLDEASAYCDRALAVRTRVYGPDNPLTLKSVRVKVEILKRSGREKEAEDYEKRLRAHGAAG